MKTIWLGSALAVSLALGSTTAFAQSDDDKSTARSLGQDGQDAFEKKDYARSADLFRRAIKIFDDAKANVPPTLLLGFARASAANGGVVASQEAYNRIIRQGTQPGAPALFVTAMEDAKKEIDPVSARIASVTINVTGCDAPQVTIDDKPISSAAIGVKKPVDPGAHLVKATGAGCTSGEQRFEVTDAKSAEVTIALKKDAAAVPTTTTPAATTPTTSPAAPPPGADVSKGGVPALAIAGFAVGGAGLLLGGVTGALALGKHSTLANGCPSGTNCPTSLASDLDSYHLMGTLSTVGFVVGGVGVAAGVIFLVTAPKAEKARSAWILPTVGPGSIGVVGQY